MSEDRLERIEREAGVQETRFHAVCSCGWIGPDHGVRTQHVSPVDCTAREAEANKLARRDHKLHSEGKPIGQAKDETELPGAPYRAPDEEGR